MKLFLFLLVLSLPLQAQITPPPYDVTQEVEETESKPVTEVVKEEAKEIKEEVRYSSQLRELHHHTLMGGFEMISSWLPFKLSAGYTYNFNKKWSIEAEFARGHFGTGLIGVDLASVSEYRYSLIARRFAGNSFHTIFGLYKDDFRAKLGSEITEDMTDTSMDEVRVEVVGATLGLGNRWQWQSGVTFGIDWIRMNLPIFDKTVDDGVLENIDDSNDASMIKDGIRKVSNVPTFVLFGIYLGYSF